MPEVLNIIELDPELSNFEKDKYYENKVRSAHVERQRSGIQDLGIRSEKVDIYCSLASELETPIDKILDELASVRYRATAYVAQIPQSGDYTGQKLKLANLK